MTRYTESEIEEAKYEIWLMNDGPRLLTAEHKKLAYAYLGTHMTGWVTLTHALIREPFTDGVHTLEAVIRRGDQVRLIRWNTFNKGFMTNHNSTGWVIFDPQKG